jgi:hypothetical protein
LAFWSWTLAFHCTRTYVLIYTLSRLTADCIFIVSVHDKVEFTVSRVWTLWGTLPPWENKSNICIRIWKLLVRLRMKHSQHMLSSNNLIFDITHR